MPPACTSRSSVRSGRSSDTRAGRSSCSRSRTSTGQPASSSPASEPRLAPGMGWNDWIRTVEVEPSLYAADFSRLGGQIDVLLRAGARLFPLDVGDGPFHEPITIGPSVLQWIPPSIHAGDGDGACHL